MSKQSSSFTVLVFLIGLKSTITMTCTPEDFFRYYVILFWDRNNKDRRRGVPLTRHPGYKIPPRDILNVVDTRPRPEDN